MQNKEKFEMPEMEVVEFDAEDVICTSGSCYPDCPDDTAGICDPL